MEASIAVDLCRKEKYQVLTGDDHSTVIPSVCEDVGSNLEKWSAVNHVTCTLTKGLYEGKGMDFDPDNDRINDNIIDPIKTSFLGLFTTTKTMLLALLRELGLLCHTALGITLSMDTGVNIARTHKVKKLCGGKLRKFLNSLL